MRNEKWLSVDDDVFYLNLFVQENMGLLAEGVGVLSSTVAHAAAL